MATGPWGGTGIGEKRGGKSIPGSLWLTKQAILRSKTAIFITGFIISRFLKHQLIQSFLRNINCTPEIMIMLLRTFGRHGKTALNRSLARKVISGF
ncbi:hypothetical protein PoB_006784000 [Plakobranchus ocellatus]|uniref:Uncharacterized protein n=1 Tax=Plakobranchus ocellatus TaxID=259542 RepID=A0AAV4DB60_9GAST|nr:hypothetical protein PoB_006784000 [Plakobranchus ocellatus]